jgi:predicted enzyme related to lactoylglutathione lyase
MRTPNLVVLYVEDTARSVAFYERLFGKAPDAAFPSYASFAFDNGLSLGLWSTQAPNFVSGGAGHRSEIAFMVDGVAEVDALHDTWREAGVTIEQPPFDAVFGRTFVALGPDGHRIRVCMPDK